MLPFYFRRLTLLAVLGLAATACAPTYQLGLKPARSSGLFKDGREQVLAVADSVEVRLSFVCYEPTRVVFEAEYYNPTKRTLVVDPVAFQYQASRGRASEPAAGQKKLKRPKPLLGSEVTAAVAAASMGLPLPPLPPRAVPACDPEPEIAALKEQAEREAQKAARVDWLGLALGVASIATDVASIGRTETRAQYESRAAVHDVAVSYNAISTAAKIGHAVAAEVMQARAANLQEFALRKVTLAPGFQVQGYLYFPRYDAADSLVVTAPVGSTAVPLEFVQVRRRL